MNAYSQEEHLEPKVLSTLHSTKEQYIDVCGLISTWLVETEKSLNTYQLTDIIVLENDVYLYTKKPGWWIGKSGSTLKSLEDRMNTNIDAERVRDYKIHIIEDKDSIFNMISTGYGYYWTIQEEGCITDDDIEKAFNGIQSNG